jgi:hypothetical protein
VKKVISSIAAIMMNAEGLEELAAPVTCAGPDDVAEAEVRAVLLAPPPFADAELTTEEAEEPGVAAVELRTTGAVLLFAEAWLVTATLRVGVGPVEVATTTLSVAGTGITVAVLVLEAGATIDCADLGAQKSTNCANCGLT